MSSTSLMTLDELIEEFDFLRDWEARCDFLIDLGFELPKLPENQKTEQNRVHGCQSNVWLVAQHSESTAEKSGSNEQVIEFLANSDAMIVNGLIAVLMAIYNHKTPQEILGTDVEAIFKRLELDRYLSPQRKNGLFGMVKRVQQIAAAEAA